MAITTTSADAAAAECRRARLIAKLGAMGNPRYRRYWFGSIASVGAIQVVVIGQGSLIVTDLGGSPLSLGYLGAATAVPTILVSLFGGVLADRMDKRHIIMAVSGLSAGLLTVLALLVASGAVEIWHVIVIAAAQGLVLGFDGPVRSSFFPNLIEKRHMTSAVALNTVMWQFSRIATPAIGGFMITQLGTEAVFFAGSGGWATMLLVMFTLRVEDQRSTERREVIEDLKAGFRYIREHRLFTVLIPMTFATHFFGMQYLQLMPLFAQRHDVGSNGLGVLFSVMGVGAIVGMLIVIRIQRSEHIGKIMFLSSIVFSSLVVLFAFSSSYRGALIAIFFAAVFNSAYFVNSMTALQLRVPAHLRGRVMGIYSMTFSLIPLGGLMGGAVADATDERWAVSLGAVILGTIALLVLLTQSDIRRLTGRSLFEPDPADAAS